MSDWPELDDARALVEAALAGDDGRFADEWPRIVGLCGEDPEARAALRDLRPALERAEELDGAFWVARMLSVLHEEPWVALEPGTGFGLIGRFSGVVDIFQLRTLLMDVFPNPGGRPRLSAAAAANARGEGPVELEETLVGAWNLYGWRALAGGELPALAAMETDHWLWNEGLPEDVPVFDGHRVVLLGPASYGRSYPASRSFPVLPATLDERALPAAGVQDWLERIAAAAGERPKPARARRRRWRRS